MGCTETPTNSPTVDIPLPSLPDRVQTSDAPRGPELPARDLQIALMGELRGEIEPCGCPTLPYGGFERRALMLERLSETGAILQLDAGEMLLTGSSTTRNDNNELRIQTILDLSLEVGVQAWTPGPTDLLAIGMVGLQDIESGERNGPAPISATWTNEEGEPWIQPHVIVEIGEIRAGIIGLSAEPSSDLRDLDDAGILVWRDPLEAIEDSLAEMPNDLDIVIGLSNLDEETNQRIATESDGLTLLLSTRDREVDEPRSVAHDDTGGGILWVETPDRGRFIQLIRMRLGSSSDLRPILAPPLQEWRDLRTSRNQRQQRTENDEAGTEELHASEALFAEVGRGRNLALVDTIPLASDLEGPTDIGPRIELFRSETLVEAAEIAAGPLPPLQPEFASSGGCPSCHSEEFSRWSFSDHARAYETLLEEGQAENPECIACHTTGFAQPGGFGSIERSQIRKYKAVQCEACHGPLEGHPDDPRVRAVPITESQCTSCHDETNSPEFDFATYLWSATCQSHEGLSPPTRSTPQ